MTQALVLSGSVVISLQLLIFVAEIVNLRRYAQLDFEQRVPVVFLAAYYLYS